MQKEYVSHRNLRFTLYDVLEADKIGRFSYYSDYDRDIFDQMLDNAREIADRDLFPFYVEMDRKKAVFEDGIVKTHPQLKKIIGSIAESGWIAAHAPAEHGGAQMPLTLLNAGLLTFYAANVNACYPFLTQGAANLILSFGNETLKNTYLPKLFSGEWQGTMALTEPQAGSSLSDLTASAELDESGEFYRITGQKIYISGGDHSACDNVVHLLIARVKGAPQGTKGISLFVVPKFRPENDQLVKNDVTTAGIYGKMGQKGYTAAHLMYGEQGDCRAWLVGEPNKGLSYMFQMMNEARIGTGLVAAGAASAAFYGSLQYANERSQGRKPSSKNPLETPILIVNHADVRRMLLFQKAISEGSIALLMYCSQLSDIAHAGEGEEKTNAHLLLELLTPIAKSYPSEMGNLSVSAAMQVLGGAGYCDDFPIEQLYRDIRVNAIYEGTTTIHGLDLLGRKVVMHSGKAVQLLAENMNRDIQNGLKHEKLASFATKLGETAQKLQRVTQALMERGQAKGVDVMLSDATLYLEYFGFVVLGWLWLKQAIVAQQKLEATQLSEVETNFLQGKVDTMRYFMEYELVKTMSLHRRLMSEEDITLSLEVAGLF